MTGTLKDLMTERADAQSAPQIDVDAILRAGDSRVRRRRVAVGAGAVGLAAAVALGAPAVIPSSAPEPAGTMQPASGEFGEHRVTYAAGATIHYGAQSIDVSPHSVETFVQTDAGFVFIDGAGTIYFTDGDNVDEIGRSEQPYGPLLAADDTGSYVGWVDTSVRPAAEFVVYDTSVRTEVVRTAAGNQPPSQDVGEFDIPVMEALDGERAYWHSSAGITSWDLTSNNGELLAPGANYLWLQDAAAGKLARLTRDTRQIVVSDDPAATAPVFDGSFADLSPNATYVYTDVDDAMKVFDVRTGEERTPDHPGYPFMVLSQWLDDDRFVAVAIKAGNNESDPLDLLTCSISTGECRVAVSEVARVNDLALPTGETLGD